MYSHDQFEAAPTRRRIIQQPLRTEPARALIIADTAQTAELEALLKRDRPLITFPSISHFLAEPARREPWAAVVIARAGAWDPRFDGHVRGRRSIALFGSADEVYSWPEAVARVRDLAELSAWLEALDAPEPSLAKAAERRERRAQARAALDELSASRLKHGAPPVALNAAAAAESLDAPASAVAVKAATPTSTVAPRKPRAKSSNKSAQLELAIAEPVVPARRGARVGAKPQRGAPRDTRALGKGAPESATTHAAAKASAERPRKRATAHRPERGTASKRAAERTLMLLAAELGLARAGALLDALRSRAAGVTRA
jgi:hypothetical protein